MYKKIISALFVFLAFHTTARADSKDPDDKLPSRITYALSDGGFGSNLLAYMHAKWVSYSTKIPLLYKPFPFANLLKMHKEEERFVASHRKRLEKTIVVQKESDVVFMEPLPILYVVPFYKEPMTEFTQRKDPLRCDVNWADPDFKKILKKMCTPEEALEEINIPKGRISVAVHVRRRQGEETVEQVRNMPLKYLSDNYYIAQIQRLYKHFHGMPLYVYIFTNDPQPALVVKKFKEALNLPKITFGCRKVADKQPKMLVLDDFIGITHFECLIRPESSFSLAAELISDHRMVISPVLGHWDNEKNEAIIDKVHIKVRR